MNWSRGLFRTWIVVSAVWIGLVLTTMWMTLPEQATVPLPHSNPNDPLADIVTDRWTEVNLTVWEAIMSINPAVILASAMIPPALLLAIGWTGLWIGRGFRRH